MKTSLLSLLMLCTGLAGPLLHAAAQAPKAPSPLSPMTQVLWSQAIPGARSSDTYKESIILRDNNPEKPRITQVTEPTLELFFPDERQDAAPAVLICPGGGYAVLAYDHEGIQVAKWFAQRGIVAAILKYRLPSDDIMEQKAFGPLGDAQEGIRVLRRKAAEWNINPNKIGIIGFSAGGHLAASATTRYAEALYPVPDSVSARPDFAILVYGVISMQPEITHKGSATNLLGATPDQTAINQASNELQVNSNTPPCFVIHSQNDPAVPVENSLRFYAALTKAKVPSELHIHERGGHGYGLGVNPDSPAHWTKDLEVWLERNGWLSRAKHE